MSSKRSGNSSKASVPTKLSDSAYQKRWDNLPASARQAVGAQVENLNKLNNERYYLADKIDSTIKYNGHYRYIDNYLATENKVQDAQGSIDQSLRNINQGPLFSNKK
ncbi:hypothetical protein LPJ73_000281 [Coemansia sp. RSA 2703]|nr:hypothetical protein LPJ73_000281 [Coemansia sp. RSA 2703]KAJ2379033.1 hypothetical protein IW150_000425 [Coemansia sp. RSA 2607]KAJ2398325.1 hypothetical protein GGI05_000159 [Coemansia sp. RSA 2603]